MIPIGKPFISKESIKYINETLSSGWISSLGKYIDKCIDFMKEKFNYKYILLTANGTCSNHLLSLCVKYKFGLKNIICPNNSYIAAYTQFIKEGFNLLPIDCDIDTWNADYNRYYINNSDDIILIVHNISSTVNIFDIKKNYPNNIIIEDACEGFLSKYSEKYVGIESLMTTLSFYANKNVTSGGEGGAFITIDEELYNYAFDLHGQGGTNKKYVSKYPGYNYRMTNIQAAFLLGQFENLNYIIERKGEIFNYYKEELKEIEEIKFQELENNTESSNWLFGIRVIGSNYSFAEEFFRNNNIETRPVFPPITYHPFLDYISCNTTFASIIYKECILLPSFVDITKEEQNYIVKVVKNYLKEIKQ